MTRIPQAELTRIKRETDLLELVRTSGVSLKRTGKDYKGRCPFHEDRTPSLVVSPDKNLWNCLGACRMGGSAIDWVMKREGVDFRSAAERLRIREGPGPDHDERTERRERQLKVKEDTGTEQTEAAREREAEKARLLEWTVAQYREQLLKNNQALAYLEGRGITNRESVERLQVGFADRGLTTKLPDKRTDNGRRARELLQEAGIIRENGQEHFAGCIVVPYFDAAGAVTGLYGRRINQGRDGARHFYPPGPREGMWNGECLQSEDVILCEGPLDMLTFHANGFRNVTSAFGVNGFTEEMLREFRDNGIIRVFIAFDRDAAGDAGAHEVAVRLADAGIEPLRVTFPKDMDANEYARKVLPAKKSLGALLRTAARMGVHMSRPGEAASSLSAASSIGESKPDVPEQTDDTVVDFDAFLRKTELPTRISGDGDIAELVAGERYYRIEGFKKNLNHGSINVSVTVVWGEDSVTDRFDFHVMRDRERFIKSAGERLELEEQIVRRDLERVFRTLRHLQDERIQEKLKGDETPVYVMTPEEERAALDFLKGPDLLERVARDVETCGVVGEELNVKAAYLASLTRRFASPLHIIIQSPTASGKSTVMNGVLDLIPDEEKLIFTEISPQALYYMGRDALVQKTIAFAEDGGMTGAEYSLKTLLSDGYLRKATTGKDESTGELRTQIHFVPGPTQAFYTTNLPTITEDLQNRALVLVTGMHPGLTQMIHAAQRKARTAEGLLAAREGERLKRLHRNVQRMLRPVYVLNPFASLLTFPHERERTRRDNAKYLTLIESIAYLYQYQRPVERMEVGGESVECVRVTRDDIRLAGPLAVRLFGASLDDLGPITRGFLDAIREMVRERADKEEIDSGAVFFTRRQVREHTKWSETQVRNQIRRLEDFEFVLPVKGRPDAGFRYCLASLPDSGPEERFFAGLIDPDRLPAGAPD